jgi:hypothetical protein
MCSNHTPLQFATSSLAIYLESKRIFSERKRPQFNLQRNMAVYTTCWEFLLETASMHHYYSDQKYPSYLA